MIYFAPEAETRYASVGLDRPGGYFASRAAALGAVGAEGRDRDVLQLQPRDRAGAHSAGVGEGHAAAHARAAVGGGGRGVAQGVAGRPQGDHRGWPSVLPSGPRRCCTAVRCSPRTPRCRGRTSTLLQLFHAQTLLREFRGDGHLAALLRQNVTGIEALVLHVGTGDFPAEVLRKTRAWSEEQWAETVADLQQRGLIGEDQLLTDKGRELRQGIEDDTDRMAAPAYDVLSDQEKERFVELASPLSKAVLEAGMMPARPLTCPDKAYSVSLVPFGRGERLLGGLILASPVFSGMGQREVRLGPHPLDHVRVVQLERRPLGADPRHLGRSCAAAAGRTVAHSSELPWPHGSSTVTTCAELVATSTRCRGTAASRRRG